MPACTPSRSSLLDGPERCASSRRAHSPARPAHPALAPLAATPRRGGEGQQAAMPRAREGPGRQERAAFRGQERTTPSPSSSRSWFSRPRGAIPCRAATDQSSPCHRLVSIRSSKRQCRIYRYRRPAGHAHQSAAWSRFLRGFPNHAIRALPTGSGAGRCRRRGFEAALMGTQGRCRGVGRRRHRPAEAWKDAGTAGRRLRWLGPSRAS
jgi:hypothetical protein